MVSLGLVPMATCAMYGMRLVKGFVGSSPIMPDGCAPTGLKYLSMIMFHCCNKCSSQHDVLFNFAHNIYLFCDRNVLEHFLHKELGPSIHVGHFASGVLLGDGQEFGGSIYGARAGEYQVVATVLFHHLQSQQI
jgi:hypothetical protein